MTTQTQASGPHTASVPIAGTAIPAAPAGFTAALASAVLAFSMMQTLLVPALPVLSTELGLDGATAGWILTAYLLSGAVAAPVIGALGDRHGHRRVLMIAMLVFVIGGAVAGLAGSLPVMLVGRVLQGAATASFPLAVAIVRDRLVGRRQAVAIGWLSGTMGLGAGLALVVGGAVTDLLSWPWLFALGAGLGLLSVLLIAWRVPAGERGSAEPQDWAGVGLLVLTLLPLLLVISQGARWGWTSPAALGLAALALLGLAGLVLVERRLAHPLIDPVLVTDRALAATNALTLFLGFVPYAFYVGLPVLLQSSASGIGAVGQGLGVTATGAALLPGAVLVFLGGRFTPWLLGRLSGRAVAAIALGAMCAGGIGIALRPGSLLAVILFFALVGLGNGIGFAVVAELIAGHVDRAGLGAALGVNGVLRTVGSAFGTPVATLILTSIGIAASGVPREETFRTLFLIAAGVSAAGVVLAFAIPARRRVET
ncbi:MFS transporter [Leucobacter sp. OAMLP11]|uniref:MFS transporter n=1 Tax=unclassified Leucobacter TaxID=2621730 RepID=UPI000C196D09|nr:MULTISPECIES: MFS transporter [unclassified Leucobacter]PIO51243.1 MFS transporter [Leucobacter sp. OAMLP11]